MSRIEIIRFTSSHIAASYDWVSNPGLQRLFLMRGRPNPETHSAYFSRVLSDPSQRVFAILEDGVHIGNCGIKNIDRLRKEGEIWIYIGRKDLRGRGIGKTATGLLMKHCVAQEGLRVLFVHVAHYNHSAVGLYRKLGFVEVPLPEDDHQWADRKGKILRMKWAC